jgi:NDP-sugar pyrophosphorylase family protein
MGHLKFTLMQMISEITAAILAGGFGTRLRPIISDRPKALAAVCNRPFILFLLDQLIAADIESAVLCIGYLGEKIKKMLGHKYRSLSLLYSQEREHLGTAGALRLASPFFGSNSVLVMNGDSYLETNLGVFCKWHRTHQSNASLLLTKTPNTNRFGRVIVGGDGKIKSFEEKGEDKKSGWINAGIYMFEKHVIQSIPANRAVSLEHDTFPVWIGQGLYGFKSEGAFIDIGTPISYQKAQAFFDHTGLI